MSIFTKIKTYFDTKRRDRLWRDIQVLQSIAKFEPKYAHIPSVLFNDDAFTRKVTEYMIWYTGNEEALRDFFTNEGYISKDGTSQNLFWEKAPSNYPMKHSGFPALIAAKMATILFGKGFDIEVDAFNEGAKEPDAAKSERLQSMLEDVLFEKIGLMDALMDGAAKESWGGHVFAKLSYDLSLSPFPILEMIDIRNAEEISRRGIVQGIVFHFWYSHKNVNNAESKYRLDEVYRTVTANDFTADKEGTINVKNGEAEIGDACIQYVLYELGKDGKEFAVPFDTIPDTADIVTPFVAFQGIKGILAISKPNKKPNNDFIDSPYGASDYAHSRTAFDALDEVASELARETRDNKSIVKWPARILPKDSETGKPYLDKFRTNVIESELDMRENADPKANMPQVMEFVDKTESLLDKYKQNIVLVCNNAEISPLALGITGLESVSASDASQRERNKATIETREKKLRLWQSTLEQLVMKVLELNAWIQRTFPQNEQIGAEDMKDVSFNNTTIKVSFPPYIVDSELETITSWGNAKANGGASIKTYVEKLHPEWTKDQVDEEVNLIRIDMNLSPENTETAMLNNMTK